MGKINWIRVLLGGLAAGVVINLSEGIMNGLVLAGQWTDVRTGLGKSAAMSVKQIVAFNVWGFAAGLLLVWLYAAIRPRLGEGPRTAICAGLAVWALACVLGDAPPVFFHLFPVGLVTTMLAVQAVEMAVAGLAGAAIYKESGDSGDRHRQAAARAA